MVMEIQWQERIIQEMFSQCSIICCPTFTFFPPGSSFISRHSLIILTDGPLVADSSEIDAETSRAISPLIHKIH